MNRSIFLTAILILILLGGGYLFVTRSGATVPVVSTSFTQEMDAKLAEYRKIETLSPNLSIFDDVLFQALRPSGAVILPVGSGTSSPTSRGRANPFIPF